MSDERYLVTVKVAELLSRLKHILSAERPKTFRTSRRPGHTVIKRERGVPCREGTAGLAGCRKALLEDRISRAQIVDPRSCRGTGRCLAPL